jgi:hypothetical protein
MAVGVAWTRICDGDGGSSASLSIGLSTSTPNYASSLTITVTPSGLTPTSYTFFITNTVGEYFMVTQASNVYAYTVLITGSLKVSVVATDGTNDVGADASFTCDNLSTVTKAAEFIYAHNTATGLTMASVQRSAITTLVNNLNGSGTANGSQFLARMVAQGSKFYPYCPVDDSTANANAYKMCLIDPSANLTFINFVSGDFTPQGLIGGVTKKAGTGLSMQTWITFQTGFHVYSRTNSALDLCMIGDSYANLEIWLKSGANSHIRICTNYLTIAVADSLGLTSASLNFGEGIKLRKRGALIGTGGNVNILPSANEIFLHCAGSAYFDTRQASGFCLGFTPITANEWADWEELWTRYQTNVITGGRQV